jgi:hypothetical protein
MRVYFEVDYLITWFNYILTSINCIYIYIKLAGSIVRFIPLLIKGVFIPNDGYSKRIYTTIF